MGFFNRKNEKEYTLGEVINLLKKPEYAKYSAIEIDPNDMNTKYKIMPEDSIKGKIEQLHKQSRNEFINRQSGYGAYSTLNARNTNVNYNNYQSANKYSNNMKKNHFDER